MIRYLVILLILQFSILFSQTQIAVVDFQAHGVSSEDAAALTDRLVIELFRTKKFKVLEREMLNKIIEEQKFQLSGCNANECLVELGQIANVQQIATGSINKVGNVYTITARLISVETVEVITSGLFDYEGDISTLMKRGMASIAAQLASTQGSVVSEVISSKTHTKDLRTTTASVTDIDGHTYKTILIGSQVWMAENLKVTHYRNGESIGSGYADNAWSMLSSGAYGNYPGAIGSFEIHKLYNWYAVVDKRELAPEGWHIPTDEEWKVLERYLGMSRTAASKAEWRGTYEGAKLKSTNGWNNNNNGNNSSGFSALPIGYRNCGNGHYNEMHNTSYFWSTTEKDSTRAWCRKLYHSYSNIYRSSLEKGNGFSVRCIKD